MDDPWKTADIKRLEKQVEALQAENLRLAERLASLEERTNRGNGFFNQLARQVGQLIDQIGTMDLQVIELAEKVFPGYIQTQQQIMNICNPPKGDGEDKISPA